MLRPSPFQESGRQFVLTTQVKIPGGLRKLLAMIHRSLSPKRPILLTPLTAVQVRLQRSRQRSVGTSLLRFQERPPGVTAITDALEPRLLRDNSIRVVASVCTDSGCDPHARGACHSHQRQCRLLGNAQRPRLPVGTIAVPNMGIVWTPPPVPAETQARSWVASFSQHV
jgi:hypothetical protein